MSILARFGQHREDGYFKTEQEADIQDLRKKLLKEGKLTEDDILDGFRGNTLSLHGVDLSPQLMEVLQMSARVHVPNAAKSRVWELRKRAGLPPISDRELEKAIMQLRTGSVDFLVPKAMRLGTSHNINHIATTQQTANRYSSRYHATPEQQELAKRQFMVGLRVAMYGSMASLLGVAVGCTLVAQHYDIRSIHDVKSGFQTGMRSWQGPIREAIAPLKATLCRWVGRDPLEVAAVSAESWQADIAKARNGADAPDTSEFQRLLKQRFNRS